MAKFVAILVFALFAVTAGKPMGMGMGGIAKTSSVSSSMISPYLGMMGGYGMMGMGGYGMGMGYPGIGIGHMGMMMGGMKGLGMMGMYPGGIGMGYGLMG